MQRLQELYPDNWTFFDLQSIYTVIDTFELFISSDTMCLDYRLYNYPEILNCTFPPLASFDSYQGALFRGTRCWADAQRDIGTSNLLACSPSDTCCKSLSDPLPSSARPAQIQARATVSTAAIRSRKSALAASPRQKPPAA